MQFETIIQDLWQEILVALILATLGLLLGALFWDPESQSSTPIQGVLNQFGKDAWKYCHKKRDYILLATVFLLAALLAYQFILAGSSSRTLNHVLREGKVTCGVNVVTPGFGFKGDNSIQNKDITKDDVEGFDIDFCKAVSAALFGTAENWEPVYLNEEERFEEVRKGNVDVAFRNTSWTADRDHSKGVDFGPPNFYDQLAILVHAKDVVDPSGGVEDIIGGKNICVATETTTYDNMLIYEGELETTQSIEIDVVKAQTSNDIRNTDQAFTAFFSERGSPRTCDAVASDSSQVVGEKFKRTNPEDYIIYGDDPNEFIAAELLSPIVPENDSLWKSLIAQVVYTTIRAEELEINQDNVRGFFNAPSDTVGPLTKNFLKPDKSHNFWKKITKENPYPVLSIIETVGNYGEIYENNLKGIYPDEENGEVKRGANKLVKYGGALISPPL
mgnify:CR=1 FL=1